MVERFRHLGQMPHVIPNRLCLLEDDIICDFRSARRRNRSEWDDVRRQRMPPALRVAASALRFSV
jgi:hypothetical protein